MYFKTQKFLVAGLSRSGVAAARFLLGHGASVCLYDDSPAAREKEAVRALQKAGARLVENAEEGVRACDVLVLSPGIPVDHPLPVLFRRHGRAILGEAELGCRFLRAPLVAVTGTNGKTTTVAMLAAIFRAAGQNCVPCGNIGRPITSVVDGVGEDTVAVAEISSFQLETLSSIRPHVAVVTNVGEDHLDRHYTMENYIFLKTKLLRNLRESEYAVLNYDDPVVRGMAEKVRCPVRWFSLREQVEGACLREGSLYFENEKIMDADRLSLRGEHNVRNALAAACAARLMGVEASVVAAALSALPGVRHRIEPVARVGGVDFIDDSKGTNVEAALSAVACMRADTILLLGGKDKGYDYDRLFAGLRGSRVVHCVLYGENRFHLLDAAIRAGEPRITLVPRFELAVRVAAMTAKAGQAVLLSPASSSFDEFSGYEERGDRFAAIVRERAEAAPARVSGGPQTEQAAPPAEEADANVAQERASSAVGEAADRPVAQMADCSAEQAARSNGEGADRPAEQTDRPAEQAAPPVGESAANGAEECAPSEKASERAVSAEESAPSEKVKRAVSAEGSPFANFAEGL